MMALNRCLRFLSGPVALGGSLCLYGAWTYSQPQSQESFWSRGLVIAKAAYTTNFKPESPWIHNWDKNHPGIKGKKSDSTDGQPPVVSGEEQLSKHTRHLILIRHGQYHYASRDEDCKLTDLGHYQAALTGQRLKQLDIPFDKLHYSTMTRAMETAEDIMKSLPNVPAKACSLLEEGAPYPPEPPLPSYNPSKQQFFEDGARIESAFQKFFHRAPEEQTKDTYEVVVCHANVIRYFLCRALQFPPEAWLRFSLDHGSITWISIRPSGRVAVRYVGSSGHMPAAKCSVQ